MREFLGDLAAFLVLIFFLFCGMVFLEWLPELLNALQAWIKER